MAGIVVGVGVAWAMWPVDCLWLPSDPPQGPGCTSVIGIPSTPWLAIGAGVVAGSILGWIVARMTKSVR